MGGTMIGICHPGLGASPNERKGNRVKWLKRNAGGVLVNVVLIVVSIVYTVQSLHWGLLLSVVVNIAFFGAGYALAMGLKKLMPKKRQ